MLPSRPRHALLVLAVDLWLKELAADCLSEATHGSGGVGLPDGTASVVIRWHGDRGSSPGSTVWVRADDVLASVRCVETEAERIATTLAREHLADGHRP